MATRLVANEWGVILRHDGHDLLELQWLPTTADMTDGGFMATLCLFASEAEKVRAATLRDFEAAFGPDDRITSR